MNRAMRRGDATGARERAPLAKMVRYDRTHLADHAKRPFFPSSCSSASCCFVMFVGSLLCKCALAVSLQRKTLAPDFAAERERNVSMS